MNEENKPTEKTYAVLVIIILLVLMIKYWVYVLLAGGIGTLAYLIFKRYNSV